MSNGQPTRHDSAIHRPPFLTPQIDDAAAGLQADQTLHA